MSRPDWLKLLAIVVFFSVIVECPYALARWHPPEGYVFRGSFWAHDDFSQYLSAANQGEENGSWLIYDKLTPEEHPPAFIFPLYVLLGHFASQFNIQIQQAYLVLLVLSRISLILAIYWFVSAYVVAANWRRLGTIMILLSSGFGAFMAIRFGLLYPQAIIAGVGADLTYSEYNTFLTLLSYPHLLLTLAALLISARAWLLYLSRGQYVWIIWLCAGGMAIGFLNPFSLPALLMILCGHAVVLWLRGYEHKGRLALGLGVAVVVCLPFIAYNYLTFNKDVFWGVVYGTQNKMPTPNPLQLISAFGVAVVLAGFGVRVCLRKPSLERMFLVVAVLMFCVLIYLPVPYQRRFAFGLHPIVACLALVAIEDAVSAFKLSRQPSDIIGPGRSLMMAGGIAFLALMALFTNSVLYYYVNVTATAPVTFSDGKPDVFESVGLVSARDWLKEDGDADQVVLAHYRTGNFLAASIPGRVFTAHRTATKDFAEKNKAVEQFFSLDTPDSWRRQLLAEYRITHVVYGPWEQQLGGFDPASCDYLLQAYSENGVSVFAVLSVSAKTEPPNINLAMTKY